MTLIAIYAVDPGVTTGIACGVYDVTKGAEVEQMVETAPLPTKIWQTKGTDDYNDVDMGLAVASSFVNFREHTRHSFRKLVEVKLVVEDFVLRPSGISSTARAGLSPVRVTAALEAALLLDDEEPIVYKQMPSEAKGFATDSRLKQWGLWEKGCEHGRDAARHLVTCLVKSRNGLGKP